MSEETTPPPALRLKPRIRPETTSVAPSVPPPSVMPSAEASPTPAPASNPASQPAPVQTDLLSSSSLEPKVTSKRFTLSAANAPAAQPKRVSLSVPAAPETENASPTGEAPAAPVSSVKASSVPLVAAPPPSVEDDSVDVGRFKLKPRLTAPESAASAPMPALPASMVPVPHPVGGPPPGIKIVATAPVALPTPIVPAKAVPFRAPIPRTVRKTPIKPENTRVFKFGLISIGILAGGFIAVGGFLGFRYLSRIEKEKLPPPSIIHPLIKKSVKIAPADQDTETPLPAPKAADSTAPLADTEPNKSAGDSIPNSSGTPTATATHPTAAVAAIETEPTPAPVIQAPPPPKRVATPSAAFRQLVVNLRVNGVFQGEPARALLNGRMLSSGEILDNQLGVRFRGIDAVHKILIFEDNTGAVMQRRY